MSASTRDDEGRWQALEPSSPIKPDYKNEQARYAPPHRRQEPSGTHKTYMQDVDSDQVSTQFEALSIDDDDEDRALEAFYIQRARKRAQQVIASRKANFNDRPAPRMPSTFSPDPASPVRQVSADKYYEGRRLTSSVFSPGYGFRPQPSNEPLPPPEELTGPGYAHHRVYPAPAPIAPVINQDLGWHGEAPQLQVQAQVARPSTPPLDMESVVERAENNLLVDVDAEVFDHQELPSPPLSNKGNNDFSSKPFDYESGNPQVDEAASTVSKSTYVPWEGGVVYNDPQAANRLFEENPYASRQSTWDREREAPRPRFGEAGSRGPHVQRPQDCGWGNSTSKNNSSGWNQASSGAYDDGYGGGGSGGAGRDCYNCGQSGHFSKDCPEPQKSRGGGSGLCFNCAQYGHMSRDCPELRGGGRGGGGGGGNCYKCGQSGHISRECPDDAQQENTDGHPKNFTTVDDGWGAAHDGNNGWGNAPPSVADAQPVADKGEWGPQPTAPNSDLSRNEEPVTATAARPAMHPDRQRMLAGGASAHSAPRQSGWGGQEAQRDPPLHIREQAANSRSGWVDQRQPPAPIQREPTPQPQVVHTPDPNDEFGGW